MSKCPYCDKEAYQVTCGSYECQIKRNRDKNREWKDRWKERGEGCYSRKPKKNGDGN